MCVIEAMLALVFMVLPRIRWISGLLFAFCTVVLLSMILIAVTGPPDVRKIPEAKLEVFYERWFDNLRS